MTMLSEPHFDSNVNELCSHLFRLLVRIGLTTLSMGIASQSSFALTTIGEQKMATGVLPTVQAAAKTTSSPTGQILFTALSNGFDHVYVMNANGTGVTELTSDPYDDVTPQWSPDGKEITFQRSENGFAVYTMNADGSQIQRLSPTPGRDLLPSWSPNGQTIIFTRIITPPSNPNAFPVTSLMVMNADGWNPQTIYSDGSFAMEPHYSPNGSKIVFMCGKPGVGVEVCTIDADGTNLTQLTTDNAVNGDPHWSHDGTKIAFGSNREGGGKLNVFVMNADGSGLKQLTFFPTPIEAGDVGWSLDDTTMAFEWDIGGQQQSNPTAFAEMWLMNADGSHQTNTGVPCSDTGCAPTFQP
jgi:Tol biopolymer transport system component